MRIRRLFFVVIVSSVLLAAHAHAQCPALNDCGTDFTTGTSNPFAEFITNGFVDLPGDGVWRDIGAIANPCTTSGSFHNINSTGTFNLAARGYVSFNTINVAVGARYETEIILQQLDPVSGAVLQEWGGGWHAKTVRGIQSGGVVQPPIAPTGNTQQSQDDWFHGAHLGIPAGDYRMSAKMRLFGGGTMHIRGLYLHAEGAPASYSGNRYGTGPTTLTVGGTWQKMVDIPVNNTSGETANYSLQGYFEAVGGTPGDRISVGFAYDNLSSGSHVAETYVPDNLPSGVHVRDVMPNETFLGLPPGMHNVQLWMKNQSGHTTQVENVELQTVGFHEVFANNYATATDIVTVNSTVLTPQADACPLNDDYSHEDIHFVCTGAQPNCGYWTKLLTMTPTVTQTNLLPSFDAYVELLGHNGTWQSSLGQIAIEVVGPNKSFAFEAGQVEFDIPSGRRSITIHGDAMNIGLNGATVNLWIRKLTCAYNGQATESGGDPTFSVGKRYLGVRSVNTDGTNYCIH